MSEDNKLLVLERTALRIPASTALARGLAVALTLAGFVLLVNGLGQLTMWGDSSYSVMVARQEISTITLERPLDSHPPLFYYLVFFWRQLAGQSELALRFLSIVPATAALALVYRLGTLLFDRHRIALLGLSLSAVSPLLVYQSRIIRMYGLFTFLTLLALYTLLMALRRGGRCRWLAYSIATLFALYTHYYALIFLLAFSCYALLDRRAYSCQLRSWLLATSLAVVLYLPWLAFAAGTAARTTAGIISNAPSPIGVAGYLGQTIWVSFNTGTLVDMEKALPMTLAILATAAGLAALAFRNPAKVARWSCDRGAFPLAVILLVVTAVCWVVFERVPYAVRPRFLMPAVPMYLLLLSWLAWRTARQRRLVALLASLLIVGNMLYALSITYLAEANLVEPEAAVLTSRLQGLVQPGDAVIFHAAWQSGYFSTHFGAPLPRIYDMGKLPLDRAPAILAEHPRLWLASYVQGDVASRLPDWLDRHWAKVEEQPIGDLRLVLYAKPPEPTTPPPADLVVTSPEGIALLRLTAIGVSPVAARPGDSVAVSLRWQVLSPPQQRYTVFVHLVDHSDERILGRDGEPIAGTSPTDTWQAGDFIDDRYALLLPPQLPSGSYRIRVGFYETGSPKARPLPTQGAADGIIAGISIRGRPPIAPIGARPIDVTFGDELALVGALLDLDRREQWSQATVLNTADGPAALTFWRTTYQPGDKLHLVLYWNALRPIAGNYLVAVRLVTAGSGPIVEVEQPLRWGSLAPDRWPPHELAASEHELLLPRHLGPGPYELRVGLYNRDANQALPAVGQDGTAGDVLLRVLPLADR